MNRILQTARIQLANARMVLGLPLLILVCVLAANVLIFTAVPSSGPSTGDNITGALVSIYIATMVVHVQTMSQMFPFALGMSVTRRDFVGAAGAIVVGQALLYGIVIWVMALIERATDGWGLHVAMFDLPFLSSGPVLQILMYAGPFLLLSFAGLWAGIVYHRWGALGVWTMTLTFGALVVGFVALASWQQWWPAVGAFVADTPPPVLLAGYPALIGAVFAGATYLTSRRASP